MFSFMQERVAFGSELEIVPIADIDLAVDLRLEFLKSLGTELDDEVEAALRESNRTHLRSGAEDGFVSVLLARWAGKIAGCAMLQEQRIIPNPPVPTGRVGVVLIVHVREPFRRRGIGEALMLEIVRFEVIASPEGRLRCGHRLVTNRLRIRGWAEPKLGASGRRRAIIGL